VIKLIYSVILGIIAGTAFGYAVKAAEPGYRFVTYMQGGRLVQCSVYTDYSGNETWSCI
jgi:hypothetical protein